MQYDQKPSFGELLRFYRRKTLDTDRFRGSYLSQERVAELISDAVGYEIHRNKVGKWEKEETTIHHLDERNILVVIIAIYFKYGGFSDLAEANQFLETGGYRTLDPQEIKTISARSGREIQPEDEITDTASEEVPRIQLPDPVSVLTENQAAQSYTFLAPNLPLQGVFGREHDLKKIADLLLLNDPHAANVPPLALRGMGGIGKTTLAIALAHRPEVKRMFPDGVLWASLGPSPTIRLLQNSWGRALGIDLLPERDEAACRDRLANVLRHRRFLLIVDDVWETIHGSYFQVAGPQCRLIFTTREVPVANDLVTRERVMRVDVLQPSSALNLLRKLAKEAVSMDETNAMRLCERLEFLPLGLTLAGRFLANEVDVPSRMQRLLSELIEHRDARLKLLLSEGRPGLDGEKPVSLQAILGMSVNRLDRVDQDRFAMLGVFGGDPLTWEINAAAHVWECSIEQAEDTIARFIQRGLVERRGDRYWMHALLADYAEEMMEQRGL